MLLQVRYGVGIDVERKKQYGTKEDLSVNAGVIANITNAYEYLKKAILLAAVETENETYHSESENKIGDFHIYEDGRDMEYIPV